MKLLKINRHVSLPPLRIEGVLAFFICYNALYYIYNKHNINK